MNKDKAITKQNAIDAIKQVEDPEIGIDLWTLGLIYDIQIKGKEIFIKMTLTSPSCPFGPEMIEEVRIKLTEIGADKVEIELVFDPPWKPSEEIRDVLGV